MDNQISNRPFLKRLLNPKLIFLVLGLIILAEVVYAVQTLRKPVPGAPAKVQPISGGKIVLISKQKEYKVGENIPVAVRVVTGGHPTDGTDLVLKYDPRTLDATGSGALSKGKIYPDYPVVNVDRTRGVIKISGIASQQKGFNGIGVFATLNLRAKRIGKTTLAVDFTKDSSADSNIIESKTAKDILDQVYNLDLTIK